MLVAERVLKLFQNYFGDTEHVQNIHFEHVLFGNFV